MPWVGLRSKEKPDMRERYEGGTHGHGHNAHNLSGTRTVKSRWPGGDCGEHMSFLEEERAPQS